MVELIIDISEYQLWAFNHRYLRSCDDGYATLYVYYISNIYSDRYTVIYTVVYIIYSDIYTGYTVVIQCLFIIQ